MSQAPPSAAFPDVRSDKNPPGWLLTTANVGITIAVGTAVNNYLLKPTIESAVSTAVETAVGAAELRIVKAIDRKDERRDNFNLWRSLRKALDEMDGTGD